MNFHKIAHFLTLSAALPLTFAGCGDSNPTISDPVVSEVSSSSGSDMSAASESASSSSGKSEASNASSSSANPSSSGEQSSSSQEPESSSSVGPSVPTGSITDARDGKVYKVVTIGTQVWTAENMKLGDSSLYVYEDALKACPENFHLPSIEEFSTLVEYAGGADVAGKKLRSTTGWPKDEVLGDWNGTDDFGFNAKPVTLGNGTGTDENFWSRDRNYTNYETENFFKHP